MPHVRGVEGIAIEFNFQEAFDLLKLLEWAADAAPYGSEQRMVGLQLGRQIRGNLEGQIGREIKVPSPPTVTERAAVISSQSPPASKPHSGGPAADIQKPKRKPGRPRKTST